jgi:hypothetical protein
VRREPGSEPGAAFSGSSDEVYGWPVVDAAGQRLGRVHQAVQDDLGRLRYLEVRRGLLGRTRLVPIEALELDAEREEVRARFERERYDSAPDAGEELNAREHAALLAHYVTGAPSAGPSEMLRSEEELVVGVRDVPYGRARLRKRIEVEPVDVRVPLYAEVATVREVEVTEPDLDSGEVLTTPEGHLSVPVFAERLVVRRERVVAKRVVLERAREKVGEEHIIDAVRRERVDAEIDRFPVGPQAEPADDEAPGGPTPEVRRAIAPPDEPAPAPAPERTSVGADLPLIVEEEELRRP